MLLSLVIPAYNEAKLIEGALQSVYEALQGSGLARRTEVIVVDNASTDGTAALARAAGAKVVHEPKRQIARARNAGAAAAVGDWLLFVDADCWPTTVLFEDLALVIESDVLVGGGSTVRMDGMGWLPKLLLGGWNLLSRHCRWAAGSFVFCRRLAFTDVGGFSTALYAAEEIDISRRLKRWGRRHGQGFRILSGAPLLTSARKFELYGLGEIWGMFFSMLRHPWRFFRDRGLCYVWYDGRR